MSVIVAHPTGNQNVREVLAALEDEGQLAAFVTSYYWRDTWATKLLPAGLSAQLRRRDYSPIPHKKLHQTPVRELLRLLTARTLGQSLVSHERFFASIEAVGRSVSGHSATLLRSSIGVKAFYGYEDFALEGLVAARETGSVALYEHPVGYWRHVQQLFAEEADLTPDYRPVLAGLRDSKDKLTRKDQEIELATTILVPSTYSARTLAEFPGTLAPIVVNGYGAPTTTLTAVQPRRSKLRVAFVGSLQQRKGVSYFVNACLALQELIQVTIVGTRVAECPPLDRFLNCAIWYESIPHQAVLDVLSEQDVLVLPSLSEGFGLVVLEAMARGATVIVTENTGAADVVQDGVNGFVVPIRSAEEIEERLLRLANNEDMLLSMRRAALETARTTTWAEYRRRLVSVIDSLLGKSG